MIIIRILFVLFVVVLVSCDNDFDAHVLTTDVDTISVENKEKPIPPNKKYVVESGIIEFVIKGDLIGTQTIYFDNWGANETQIQEYYIDGDTTITTTIYKLDKSFIIDNNSKIGIETINPFLNIFKLNKSDEELLAHGKDMMIKNGGRIVGKKIIAGLECDEWELLGIKTWVWQTFTLKTLGNITGVNMDIEATKFKQNIELPENIFEIPEGIKIKDIINE